MKITLLEIVQKILSDMDSENVNSLSDSVEAMQIASIVEDTYYSLISMQVIPDHESLLELEALSDNTRPTHFKYGTNVKDIQKVWYDYSETAGETEWQTIRYLEPLDFLNNSDNRNSLFQIVEVGGTELSIGTDQHPCWYTSFDNNFIIMNSFKSTVDSSLQASKSRAYGTTLPTFTISDSFVPDLSESMSSYLLAEAKSTALVTLKGEANPKVEQQAKRMRNFIQNDRRKTRQGVKNSGYGR